MTFKPRKFIKKILQEVTQHDFHRIGTSSFAFISRDKQFEDGWFLYQNCLRAMIQRLDVNLIVDIGANMGQFGQQIRSFYNGEIISFEPISSVFQTLKQVIQFDPKWNAYQYALGSRNSTETMHVTHRTEFSSFLLPNSFAQQQFGSSTHERQPEEVAVRRLDELLSEIATDLSDKRLFVKMDTQGFDLEVFRGMQNILPQVVALQSEVSLLPLYREMPHWTESIVQYEKAGLQVIGMFPVSRNGQQIIEYDCVMAR